MIKITTDSTSDLPRDIIEKYNIEVLPLIVNLGDNEFFDDGVSVTQDKIFEFVKQNNILPKTAARSIPDYVDFFERVLKDADFIIHIGIGAELSCSYRNALLAKEEVDENRIFVVDSKSLSSGIGLLVLEAAKLANEGMHVNKIVERIEYLANKAQTSFVVEKLDYLYKGGRCSKFSFSMGAMLKIKPRLQLIDGKMINTGKDIGPTRVVLKKYVDFILSKYPNPKTDLCLLAYTKMDPNLLNEITEYVKSKGIFKEVRPQLAGSVITSHCGESTLGMLYLCE